MEEDTITDSFTPRKIISDSLERLADPRVAIVSRHMKMIEKAIERTIPIFRNKTIEVCKEDAAMGATGVLKNLDIGILSRDVVIRTPVSASEEHFEDADEELCELEAYCPIDPYCSNVDKTYYKLLKPVSVGAIELARDKLYNDILKLCNDGCNLICINEIGYPAFRMPIVGDNDCEEVRDQDKKLIDSDRKFRQEIQNLANGKLPNNKSGQKCIILAGSYHDPFEMTNNAMIFFPDWEESPKQHQKLTTAKSPNIGEMIRTPTNPYFPIYNTHLGTMSVLVCLDAYDLNMFFRQTHLAQHNPKISPSIILVPAFSPKSLADACIELSLTARAIVIYSNPMDGNNIRAGIFSCGKRLFTSRSFGASRARSILHEDINQDRSKLLRERTDHLYSSTIV